MLNRIIAALFLIFFGLTSVLFYIVALVIWVLTVLVDRRLIVLHLFTSFWASLYLWTMPAWSVHVDGRRKDAWKRNYVIVSNHQSQLDILVAFRLFIPFKWVSKIEVFKLPFLGWNMRLNRYIKLKRGDKAGIAQMFADCEKALSQGNSIFIFPEGTRSKTGELKPFKPGAFILAKKMGVPILPVVISGTNAALPKHSLNFHGRQHIRIRMLDPLAPERFDGLSVEALSNKVHAVISDELEKMAPA
ncbi:MAG: 1-acyl-sn-glycerol-3-phosphate acyltransferase [Desulfosarcina sp.]|nr:1-acyl-sn-glycerol-3-phosphate acyltransferase [Desulfosarcina sp.]MBC2742250.1 1-acyl-sn-glycerol-3-phosphate acyltransferase [Desulfosarcina sp.]MBC2765162.1 1-acyl-sn-glycerol-3-phosphate acyltransferase [Desulfosarcina sp.]